MNAPDRPGSLADGQWHRLHPLTPLFKGGFVLIILGAIIINSLQDRITGWFIRSVTDEGEYRGNDGDPLDWVVSNGLVFWVLLASLGLTLLIVLGFYFVWRFQQFRVTDEHVELRKGIIFRSHRRAPLDRVQSVNLTRPFPARLIGMAKLEVVGAGNDANVPLEYLSTAKAEAVRADILRLASGARSARERALGITPSGTRQQQIMHDVGTGVSGLIQGVDLEDVVPESVVKIPAGRLVGSQLVEIAPWFVIPILALVGGGVGTSLASGTFEVTAISMVAVLAAAIPMTIAFVVGTWAQISKSLRYSIAPTPDGVRVTYGLMTTVTETIPPGRIFAVQVSQPLLWRPFGWWKVTINRMSGKSASEASSGSQQQFNVMLPVGTDADVGRVLGLVLPDLPQQDVPLLWEHGILGPQRQDPYQVMPKRAWWRRPLSWRRHGFIVTPFALMMRRGRIWRNLAVVPLARMQGISAAQGPIDRFQKVAWMQAHSVTGPINGVVVGQELDVVNNAVTEISLRATAAARGDHTHRWADHAS